MAGNIQNTGTDLAESMTLSLLCTLFLRSIVQLDDSIGFGESLSHSGRVEIAAFKILQTFVVDSSRSLLVLIFLTSLVLIVHLFGTVSLTRPA